MLKQSDEFGALVREILAERKLALLEVAERSKKRISYGTVRAMAQQGVVPGPELIVEFARAVDAEDRVNELLDRAGVWYLRYAPAETTASVRRRGRAGAGSIALAAG